MIVLPKIGKLGGPRYTPPSRVWPRLPRWPRLRQSPRSRLVGRIGSGGSGVPGEDGYFNFGSRPRLD